MKFLNEIMSFLFKIIFYLKVIFKFEFSEKILPKFHFSNVFQDIDLYASHFFRT